MKRRSKKSLTHLTTSDLYRNNFNRMVKATCKDATRLLSDSSVKVNVSVLYSSII